MSNEIISYLDMCQREGTSLQKGMNFQLNDDHSVILMSVRANAPYQDRIEDDGMTLIYEGHDEPRSAKNSNPKSVDQPEFTSSGRLTENGKFHRAAQAHKLHGVAPEPIRVYEKLRAGIWSYNGLFHLVDSWTQFEDGRKVFKFKLVAIDDHSISINSRIENSERTRVIPTHVKLEVWKRDKGCCVTCGATDELHFDHIIPYSKGGTSLKAENIQLLCARHNLEKRDKLV